MTHHPAYLCVPPGKVPMRDDDGLDIRFPGGPDEPLVLDLMSFGASYFTDGPGRITRIVYWQDPQDPLVRDMHRAPIKPWALLKNYLEERRQWKAQGKRPVGRA